MSALVMPDMEAWAYQFTQDLGGIHVFQYDAQAGWPYVTETVYLQFDIKASGKARARERAYAVRQRILDAALDPPTPVAAAQIAGGPTWLPEEDGAPRYVLRIALTVRGGTG